MRLTRRALLAGTTATVAVGVAGCTGGGTGDDGEDTDTTTVEETTVEETTADGDDTTEETDVETTDDGATDATVMVRSHPDFGDVLVDSSGMTLYVFDRDAQGEGSSACSGGCAENWPPLTVDADGAATAGPGVAAELSAFEREDGTTQVAANGWPLYYFANDVEPGDANGQGVGDVWWVLAPDGTPVTPTTTTTSGPGYGVRGGEPSRFP